MQDGRMSSRVSIELYGPDGQLKGCPCEDCPNTNCADCPQKEEDNG